jgi:hypothetical protein
MTGFWDHVYHGIKNGTLNREVVLRLIDALHELDHGTDHKSTDDLMPLITKEDYDEIMDVII